MTRRNSTFNIQHSTFVFLCLLLILAAPLLAAPAAAQTRSTAPAPHLGYGIHLGPHLAAAPELIRQLGMDWVKLYDLEQVAQYAADFRILYRLDVIWPRDGNWEAYRNNVAARVRDLAPLGVDAIEVHNEPNLSLEWPHGPDAREFTEALRAAYETIKSIAPQIIVVSGGLAPADSWADGSAINDMDFARAMLEAGAASYFDAFGYHPYGFDQPPEADPTQHPFSFRRVERIRDLLVRYGAGDKPIWLTEFGWLLNPAERGVQCADSPAFNGFGWIAVSSQVQADYTVRAFAYADQHWPWAGPMFLWNLNWQLYDTDYEDACSHLRWFSMLAADGTPTAVFYAVAAMPRRYASYRPQIEVRPLPDPNLAAAPYLGLDAAASAEDDWIVPVGAYCPQVIRLGEFQVLNTGWWASVLFSVEPVNVPGTGLPLTFVSSAQARFGDRVTVYVDVSQTPPGQYMLVVNLRGRFEGRPISSHARLTLYVENSPVNCE